MGSSPHGPWLVVLSLAAGAVDAMAFLHAGVFPANMTGNTVVLAIALAQANASDAALPVAVLVAFAIGAAGGAIVTREPRREWSRRVSIALGAAAALVLLGALVWTLAGPRHSGAVILTALAMGLQSAAVQHLGVPGVATVFITGTFTTAVVSGVGKLLGPPPGASPGTTPPSAALPAASWTAYFGGAIGGAAAASGLQGWPLAVPALIIMAVALVAAGRTRA